MTYEEQINILVADLSRVLKPDLDPVRYATALLEEALDDHYEIPGRHTRSGNPVTGRITGWRF